MIILRNVYGISNILCLVFNKECKAIADSPVGQVLAGSLFQSKSKFHFTESK